MKNVLRKLSAIVLVFVMAVTILPSIHAKADEVDAEEFALDGAWVEDEYTEEEAAEKVRKYYRFVLDEAGTIRMTYYATTQSETWMRLFSEDLTVQYREFQCSFASESKPLTKEFIANLEAGTYYLTFNHGYAAHPGYFKFRGTFTPAKNTEGNENHSFADAQAIRTGGQKINGFLSENQRNGEPAADYYKFSLNDKTKLTFTLVTQFYGANIYLYDDNYVELQNDYSVNGSEDKPMTLQKEYELEAGSYYVMISCLRSKEDYFGRYSFSVKGSVVKPGKPGITSISNSGSKKLSLAWTTVDGADGYQVQYAVKSNFKNAKNKTFGSDYGTISGLKKGKKYFVRVRAYTQDGSNKTYGAWSAKKSVKIYR